MINHHINTAKMIGSLNNIIYIEHPLVCTYGICLKNIAGLIMGQTTALDMIRMISQFGLRLMINTTGILLLPFIPQNVQ